MCIHIYICLESSGMIFVKFSMWSPLRGAPGNNALREGRVFTFYFIYF